jgi:hypothetical protein
MQLAPVHKGGVFDAALAGPGAGGRGAAGGGGGGAHGEGGGGRDGAALGSMLVAGRRLNPNEVGMSDKLNPVLTHSA